MKAIKICLHVCCLLIGFQLSAGTNITGFTLPWQIGSTTIGNGRIDVTIPNGTNVKQLSPTVGIDGTSYTLFWAKGDEANGCPHYYHVYDAVADTMREWEVYFTFASSNQTTITAASLPGQVGSTVQLVDTFLITLPYGTNTTALAPVFEYAQGASISPTGVQDFSQGKVAYTITSQDASQTKTYWVGVSIASPPISGCNIISLTILGVQAQFVSDTVLFVPLTKGTHITQLIPFLTLSPEASVYPISGSAQNFTYPVYYTVKAQDGTTKRYKVTVTGTDNGDPTKVDQLAAAAITLAPNPASHSVRIVTDSQYEVRAVEVLTLNGATCMTLQGNVQELAVSSLSEGMYLVRIHLSTGAIVYKKMLIAR